MKGGTNRQSQGFTIVETLIVLAVTAAMFLAAVVYISGRQNKAMFTDAMQDTKSRILAMFSDVSNSVYPKNVTFGCEAQSIGSSKTIKITAGSAHSADGACVYIGKVWWTAKNTSDSVVDTVMGVRLANTGAPAMDTVSAGAVIVNGQDTVSTNPDAIDLGDHFTLKNGLTFVSASACATDACDAAPSKEIYGLAMINLPVKADGSGLDANGNLKSGSISPTLVGISPTATTPPQNTIDAPSMFKLTQATLADPSKAIIGPAAGYRFCFASSSTDQSVLYIIGNNSGGLTLDTKVKDGKTC